MSNISKEYDEKQKEIRDDRKKDTGEIFTPPKLVLEMLNKLPDEAWKEGKTFCDPACGNGEFLVWILLLKIIKHNHTLKDALYSIYGVDIMPDNIKECRLRLLKIIHEFGEIDKYNCESVLKNIICKDSLDPEFDFDYFEKEWKLKHNSKEEILNYLENTKKTLIFENIDKVSIPEIIVGEINDVLPDVSFIIKNFYKWTFGKFLHLRDNKKLKINIYCKDYKINIQKCF